jgi:hypothetical protein
MTEEVGPDPAARPRKVVDSEDPLTSTAHPDNFDRLERPRIAADKLAAAVAGQDVFSDCAHAPARTVIGALFQQLQRAGIPAQGDPLPPGQLPDVVTGPGDPLAE